MTSDYHALHKARLGSPFGYVYSFIIFHVLRADESPIDGNRSDENPKRLSIFSVHVHPDGSRIATGGLDTKVRIWSTKPILNEASENSGKPPKSLCTLTMHAGPVLTVRWAHNGRWLASGSDDQHLIIWDLNPYVENLIPFSFLTFTQPWRRKGLGLRRSQC